MKLGEFFAHGKRGLPKDAKQATKWYRKMDACEYEVVSDEAQEQVAAWLHEHAVD